MLPFHKILFLTFQTTKNLCKLKLSPRYGPNQWTHFWKEHKKRLAVMIFDLHTHTGIQENNECIGKMK